MTAPEDDDRPAAADPDKTPATKPDGQDDPGSGGPMRSARAGNAAFADPVPADGAAGSVDEGDGSIAAAESAGSGPAGAAGASDAENDTRRVQKAVRRLVRANDMQSRALARATGLTAAQLVILRGVLELGEVTTNALSAYADLSAATVVIVLDKLEERGIVTRYRSRTDRRIVHTVLTERGRALVESVPGPYGGAFTERFAALPAERRRTIVENLEALAAIL